MGEIVSGGAGGSPRAFDLPSFEPFEELATKLQGIREAAATAMVATPDLVAGLDEAVRLAEEKGDYLRACAAPAMKAESIAYLALLMKAFTNSGLQDAKVFGRLMLEDVMSMSPPLAAIEIACRRWRRKSKFLPAIAELLVEVKAAKDQVENTVEFIGRLPALRERAARDLGG